MRQLSLEWTKGIKDPDKKKNFEDAVRNSTIMAGRLFDLCDEWEAELNTAESKISDYDTPSWSVKQAHRNGDRSRIRKLRDLLSFLKGDLK